MVINKSQSYIYFHNISYGDSITLDSHFDCILCGRRFFFKFIYFQKLKKRLVFSIYSESFVFRANYLEIFHKFKHRINLYKKF